MDRIEVYLGGDEIALLDRATRETETSRSELIRRAVQATLGREDKGSRLKSLQSSAGSWQRDRCSGSDYVDAMRDGDLNERLARLGVK